MRDAWFTGLFFLSGCLQPNLAYLGESASAGGTGSTTTAGGSIDVEPDTSSTGSTNEPPMGSSSSGTDGDPSGSDEPDATGEPTACVSPPCFDWVRCFDTDAPPSRVAVGDVNGDGRDDVVTLSNAGSQAQVFHATEDGSLIAVSTHAFAADARDVTMMDFDEDGENEFVVAVASVEEIVFVQPESDERKIVSLGEEPSLLRVADANADGVPDLAVGVAGNAGVAWVEGLGGRAFNFGPYAWLNAAPIGMALGSISNDDRPDAVVVTDAMVEIDVLRTLNGPNFADPVGTNMPGTPTGVALADFDGDGELEIAVARTDPNELELFSEQPGLTFSGVETLVLDGVPGAVQVADLDLDGNPEIIVAMRSKAELLVYRGNPNYAHGDPLRLRLPDAGSVVEVGDLNGDGLLDLVAPVEAAAEVCVVLSVPG